MRPDITLQKAAFATALALLVTGCAPEKPPLNLSPEALAAVQDKWQGTWSGGWGGSCKSRIDVSEVTGNGAYVVYHFQNCGGTANGSFVDRSADIDGEVLTVAAGFGTAVYTMTAPDQLSGRFSFDGGSSSSGMFARQ